MPRDLRPLDPTAGKEAAFAAELRKLYEGAGRPKFLQMARKTGKSRTALSEAVGGDHLPTWETVAAFVSACGSNPDDWRARWEEAREQARAAADPEPANLAGVEPGDNASRPNAPQSAVRRALPYALVALIAATVSAGVTLALMPERSIATAQPASARSAVAREIITVQNKVALGANDLIEDATPAYLSTEPSPFCANKQCKVEGTEIASGAMLVATCHVQGVEMFNYNLDSSESKDNPHRARSTLWYWAVFPDGRAGYISEVYIAPEDRGGAGLSQCSTSNAA